MLAGVSPEPKTPASASIPVVYALSGPMMALAAIVPLLPDGRSFVRIVIDVLAENPQQALMLIGFSTPFVLGLCLTALFWAAYEKQAEIQELVEQVLRSVVALLMAQFLLTAGQLWWASLGIMPGALFGVMIVCSAQLAIQSGQRVGVDPAKGLDTPDTRLYVRWAMIALMAICAWMRLQATGGFYFGWALELILAAGALTLWAMQSDPPEIDRGAHRSPAREEPSELPPTHKAKAPATAKPPKPKSESKSEPEPSEDEPKDGAGDKSKKEDPEH